MLHKFLSLPLVFLTTLVAGQQVPVSLNGTSSFSFQQNGTDAVFQYSTADPHAKNWIGIYTSDGGPVNQIQVEPALEWTYTPDAAGSVSLPTEDLAAGDYKAFFLARDGYVWLADPITVRIAAVGISFPGDTATLRNAKVGVAYSASVGGLASSKANFEKVSGADWVSVSSSGELTGTPTAEGAATVTVRASANYATADLVVTIPVRDAKDCLVQDVRVMTYNMWSSGTNMRNHHQKQLRALIDANVDIVGLQEADATRVRALSEALGWHYFAATPGRAMNAILSRYPIAEEYDQVGVSVAARVALDGNKQQINIWNTHLTAYPYGPYEACRENKTVAQILETEASAGREGQITTIVDAMRTHIAANETVPVMLTGDLNAPSHQDWTPELARKNCGYSGVQWPTSRVPTDAGLLDSFRVANRDPVAVEGTTWSPIYPFSDGATGLPEPQDRIDYVFYAGDIGVSGSKTYVLGSPRPVPGHADNEWTSDHMAVVTEFKLNSGKC